MHHSDRKLTDKIYTDSNLLPTGEVIRNLPDDENLIKILTEITGTDRQMLARIVQRWGSLSYELKQAVLRVVG
jgi:hypothetical protein